MSCSAPGLRDIAACGSANGNRTRISALKGPRANRCTIAPYFEIVSQPPRPSLVGAQHAAPQLGKMSALTSRVFSCRIFVLLLVCFAAFDSLSHVAPR